MNWLRKIFKLKNIHDNTSSSLVEFHKLPNATALKEKFVAERNAQKEKAWKEIIEFVAERNAKKEKAWVEISESIKNAMSRGNGYVFITARVYKNIPFDELLHEIKRSGYKLKNNRFCGIGVKYCYNMEFDLSICWE